jgi:phosphatidylserine decarboxylase
MTRIFYFDRQSKVVVEEQVYGGGLIRLLYGKKGACQWVSPWLLPLLTRIPLFSALYGWFQKSSLSRFKVKPFIRDFGVDTTEFLDSVESFNSFNAFFTRHLDLNYRPFAKNDKVVIMPADARYLVFPNIAKADGFWVKGRKFSLETLLQDRALAARYAEGAMAIARLCPVDYHRFHFPCDAVPRPARPVAGPLFSVSPIALRQQIEILSENKRMITALETAHFGTILCIEVGATCVGTIHQTYTPMKRCAKGEEKGYFSFGGSCLILLFEPGRILFDADLLEYSAKRMEVRALLGQTLGYAP